MRLGIRLGWLAAPFAVTVLTGCTSTAGPAPNGVDLSPIVVEVSKAVPSPAPSGGSVAVDATSPVTDPLADLEIDDQVGDGRTVVITAVNAGLPTVHIVIETLAGQVLGSDLRTAGRQPVTLRLDKPVTGRTELVGRMLVDDGDGLLEVGTDRPVLDDEGEQVAEDFDYVFTRAQLTDD